MKSLFKIAGAKCLVLAFALFTLSPAADAADLKLMFLGDNGHHRPEVRFQELAPALEARGIELKYTDRMEDLNAATLGEFDGLVLYANIDRIEDNQAQVVLDYVASGKGFIPLHCATYCWRNNAEMVALMGAQFQRHGGQVFTTVIAEPGHPVMKGYGSFTSWDETYIHHLHNEENRTVLEYRVEGDQAEGRDREPWTWVRTHGKGRVFYTAWGHDQRTFSNPGFHNLVERGIRWACGDDPSVVPAYYDADTFVAPKMTELRTDVAPFEYVDVGPKIPNYTPGAEWGKQGQPHNMMQLPLSPEESMKHFVTPVGMAVRLYADERDFVSGKVPAAGNSESQPAASAVGSHGKPIAMNWDERGRLWICETVDYPNELGRDRDRIRICEDTDGDHVADKFTVFAEGLSIPTAIVIVRGGAVVQNGTETIYLKDSNGDDVADEKTTLITGWALGDTHGGVSNFRYGLDNWIWAMQGYNRSNPTFPGGEPQSFRMGFFRFKLSQSDPPKVTDLEFVRSSNNNTWGLGISEEGLIFGSTANHNPSMFMPIPNRYYERVRGWAPDTLDTIADTYKFKPITDKVRQVDQFGGYTAGAGHALYTARTFPKQWWNKTAFVCGPTGHLVGTFVLRKDGAGYTSTSPTNLLASDDEWSAPIMAEVGPDGAVWVIDWYNYIVQHNPTPQGFETGKGNAYESDLRDKKHGRIYRVVPTGDYGDTVHEFGDLSKSVNSELVKTLKHPSMQWRLQAQRLLVERGAVESVPDLLELLADESVDAVGLNAGAIHALHALHGLGVMDEGPKAASVGSAAPESAISAAEHQQEAALGKKSSAAEHQQEAALGEKSSAAERRHAVAPGVSPGLAAYQDTKAPEGRHNLPGSTPKTSAAPSGLDANSETATPGLRPGLPNAVPPGLNRALVLTSLQVDGADSNAVMAALAGALCHPSAAVRRNAIAVLPHTNTGLQLLMQHSELFEDADAQVQVQAFLTLADMPAGSDAAAAPIFRVAPTARDAVLVDALTAAASVHATTQLSGFSPKDGDATPAANLQIVQRVAEHVGRGRASVEGLSALIADIESADPRLADVVLRGLMSGWPADHRLKATPQLESSLTALLERVPASSKGQLLKLASVAGSKALESHAAEIVNSLLTVITDEDASAEDRIKAARDAISFQDDNTDVVSSVLDNVTAQSSPAIAAGLIEAAGLSRAADVGEVIVENASGLTPQSKSVAVRVLLSRPDTTAALLDAIESRTLELGDLSLDQKQALASHPDATIRERAAVLMAAGGGLPDPDRENVLQSLMPVTKQTGDVALGKEMFIKHCSKCHMHGTEGKTIGPNLTGMAVHPKAELLTHIIDPSRSVEGNFRMYTVVTIDGLVIGGMMTAETRTSVSLIDTEGKEHQIAREDIDELVASRKSVMPDGFEKQMTKNELGNLLEFLTNKGQFLPISLDRYATAISTKGLFANGDNGPDRMVFDDWSPKISSGIPFILTDPRGRTVPNIILLNGPRGTLPPGMPKSVELPCNSAAKAIHLLSGVGGWSYPFDSAQTVSMIVRLHFEDGSTEDHELINGVHFADYIRRVDVPGSEFAFALRGQQIRRVTIEPKRGDVIHSIELIKGDDATSPIVMAVTVERP
ncbi:MAG: ThuA domain-containing protein [Planctomycetaceae bacterium]